MTTKGRPMDAEPGVQGELEMTGGDPAPGAPAPLAEVEAEDLAAAAPAADGEEESPATAAAEPPAGEPADAEVEPDGRLVEALDGLDRRVTLLLERYEELAARHRRTLEERRSDREALERLAASGASPAELDARIRELEAENDRLARHAGFLEERIQSLLSRVRYVIEA